MPGRLAVFVIGVVGLVGAMFFARELYLNRNSPRAQFEECKVRVLTYSTFISSTGPGHKIFSDFENQNGCKIEVTTAGDAGLLIERAKLVKGSAPVDVIIGLDQLWLNQAREKLQWRSWSADRQAEIRQRVSSQLGGYLQSDFLPYDWSPMSFVHRGAAKEVHKVDDLLDAKFTRKIGLQGPHSSSPGMQFYTWIFQLKGKDTESFLRALMPNVNSISPNWALSYGLFKKGQSELVFSYLTSLAYHWREEKDRQYQIVQFAEGHPVQVEYAGVLQNCNECERAEKLIMSLLEASQQLRLMNQNYMLPVVDGLQKGTIFEELPSLKILNVQQNSDLNIWDKVFK